MSVRFWSLTGSSPFREVLKLQHTLLESRAAGRCGDTVLFLEHAPVVTRGRGLQWRGEARDQASLPYLPEPGVDYFEIERGGDLTFHGPGQLVAYPICHLRERGLQVVDWVRRLEQWLISALKLQGIEADIRKDFTGVWVGDHKIASLGIALRKWVSFHGVALNAVNDLQAFQAFSPCGLNAEVMTRVLDQIPAAERPQFQATWRSQLEDQLRAAFRECFGETGPIEFETLSLPEALDRSGAPFQERLNAG